MIRLRRSVYLWLWRLARDRSRQPNARRWRARKARWWAKATSHRAPLKGDR